jgi:hypothetical protein
VLTADSTASSLRHDWWDGSRWNFETLDGPGSAYSGHTTDAVGSSDSMVVYNGQLHVLTADSTASSLRHDWWDGSRWNFETIDGSGSAYSGHTTDAVGFGNNSMIVYNGQLHVLTLDHTGPIGLPASSLRHDWWDGSRWNFEILDGPGSSYPGHSTDLVGIDNSVTVYNGQLQVFTNDLSAGSLRHDWWDGSRWNFEVLDGPGSAYPGRSTDPVGLSNAVLVYGTQLQVFASDFTSNPASGSLRHDWWG